MRKSQKQDDPEREARYPAWPPRVLLEVKLIPPGNPDDLEKAQWLWVNRPKPDRWDRPILEAVIAPPCLAVLVPLAGAFLGRVAGEVEPPVRGLLFLAARPGIETLG